MGLFSWLKRNKTKDVRDTVIEHPNAQYPLTLEESIPDFRVTISIDPLREREAVPKLKLKAILSNQTLTVFLPSGDVLTHNGATRDLYMKVTNCTTEEEIKLLMLPELDVSSPEAKEEGKREKKILEDAALKKEVVDLVQEGEDFYTKDKALYMKGINLSIPASLAREFLKAAKEEEADRYNSLKNFWCWCALNPNPEAREDLFQFLENGDFKITQNGNFLAYRNVQETSKNKNKGNKELTAIVSSKYLQIKTKWKKKPSNYNVVSEGDDYSVAVIGTASTPGVKIIGNLEKLYQNLSDLEDNEFTDACTHTMKIVVGKEVSIPRTECDESGAVDCSRGLHVGNSKFPTSSFGAVMLLCAVNPMNVVAVPRYNPDKMRTCAYYPLAILDDSSDKNKTLEQLDALDLEETYFSDQVGKIESLVKNHTVKELSEKKWLSTDVDSGSIGQIINVLETAKKAISERVVKV